MITKMLISNNFKTGNPQRIDKHDIHFICNASPLPRKLVKKPEKSFPMQKHHDYFHNLVGLSWEIFYHCLKVFKQMKGHLLIPLGFTVPHSDYKWPKQTWGKKLGMLVLKCRQRRQGVCDFQQLGLLKEIGFSWTKQEAIWNEWFLPSLYIFKAKFKHVNVPENFVIPSDESSIWPKLTWNYKFGLQLKSVLENGAFAEFVDESRQELNNLGLFI